MHSGIEIKFIILFAILIALTGFTFESQSNDISVKKNSATVTTMVNHN